MPLLPLRAHERLAGVRTTPGRHHVDREDPKPDMAAHDEELIGGRYQRLEPIGRGSFGEVWRVWDPRLEQEMAVKILAPREEGAADPVAADEDRQRFRREARETWKFRGRHNIVLVYDFGEHRGQPFLVMQLMRGETLRDLLRREVRLTPPRAVEVLRQIANAIGQAHRSRLVHRDVKPANVFVEAGDEVTLLDFGMLGALDAGRLSQLTERGGFGGTLEYMAPERFPGDDNSPPEAPSSPPGDIYSLACVFCQCLTGKIPFEGDVYEVRWKHRHGPRPRPGSVDPELAEFDEVVARGLAIDPAVRPQRAAEFVAGVEDALISWRERRSRATSDPPVRSKVPSADTRAPAAPTSPPPLWEAPTEPPAVPRPIASLTEPTAEPRTEAHTEPRTETQTPVPASEPAIVSGIEHSTHAPSSAAQPQPSSADATEQASPEALPEHPPPAPSFAEPDERPHPLTPVLLGGASTGIVGAGAVLLAGTSPVTGGLAIAASWAAGACLGWWYGSRGE